MKKESQKTAAVIIGRFQPFHNGHLSLLIQAIEQTNADQIVFVIGSSEAPSNIKNPFTFEERVFMIQQVIRTLMPGYKGIIEFVPSRDYLYSDQKWITEIRRRVMPLLVGFDQKYIVGYRKDDSSYYLDLFPELELMEVNSKFEIHATDIRNDIFKHRSINDELLPSPVVNYLKNDWLDTTNFRNLRGEWNLVAKQKRAWSKAPYPPVFVTVDAVVLHKGRVLMVRRGAQPGKGLMALPGGYLDTKNDRDMLDGARRELEEETGLNLGRKLCQNKGNQPFIFDSPERSVRGRIVTGAFLWVLDGDAPLRIKPEADSDADSVFWVPLEDLDKKSHLIFEDHSEIIQRVSEYATT